MAWIDKKVPFQGSGKVIEAGEQHQIVLIGEERCCVFGKNCIDETAIVGDEVEVWKNTTPFYSYKSSRKLPRKF